MTISINDINSGIGLKVDGGIFLVLEYQHVKPGKGSAFVRVKMRNIRTDNVIERTYRSSEKLEDIHLDEKELDYMYRAGDQFHFMDHSTYEQLDISQDIIGDNERFLIENLSVTGLSYDHEMLKIILPNFITTGIIETEPGIRGDSSRAGNKPAKIETGAVIQVPLFVSTDDIVKIDTRTGQYVERVQK